MERFDQTYNNKLIYVFSMPYKSHKGLLKVGETTVTTDIKPNSLTPNCRTLNQAAKARIDSYTKTASLSYKLEYTELALKMDSGFSYTFKDKDVHNVLMNSGIHKVQPNGATGEEWFATDIETVKAAIKAVKSGIKSLSSESIKKDSKQTAIDFREEQNNAVEKTVKVFKKEKEMLWNAKMRFGKTLSALEVIRQSQYRKVIIVTHRPVVDDGWSEDFKKVFFPGNSEHEYLYERKTKDSAYIFDEKTDLENDLKIRKLDKNGAYFIYFASVQDLRGSEIVGGKFNKNNAVFELDWDLIVIDEAHEGTQTELGENVINKLKKDNTKVLSLSGTPFNLLDKYNDENVYTWDYVMEQKAKEEWDLTHFGDHNPYADLPKMHIFTYDLGEQLREYVTDELGSKAFNFREFFRVFSKDAKGNLPSGAVEGKFVHENDVISFLNMLVKENIDSGYPFSTPEYREMFRHTLWMIPGVKEARALSELLHNHPVFGQFGIANVAGEGDKYEEEHAKDALELVRNTIKNNKYSITLSCGKLTTGVTVKEWSAVLMLSGSYSTAAAQYMQTIFRVQSAGSIDGKQKTDCYVFDFAPDRALKVLTETVHLSRRPGKSKTKNREAMGEFLNYCPVIAIAGSRTKSYSVSSMMEQIKQIYAERAVNSGFDDDSLYNDELLKLDKIDASKFNELKGIIGTSKATNKKTDVEINGQGLTEEEVDHLDDPEPEKKQKKEKTPEELELAKKKREAKEARKKAIAILRGISIRMPLLIYGANVPMDEDINIDHFVELVDNDSWKEFMPKGVTKKIFKDFTKYYDRDVFIAAGKRIRRLAAAADKETPTRRVIQIAEIFRHFKNPDKETILTPWRVVNMHMSNTIGGWCFFNEKFEDDTQTEKYRLDEPQFVDRGEVTKTVFGENAHVLEINSKTGLYPLYVAYSFYRQKLNGKNENDFTPEECQAFWNEVVENNIFVICKTPMAKYITKRTLCGYSDIPYNAHYFDNLVNMLKNEPEQFRKEVLNGLKWEKDVKEMKFDAVVGNPPYQMMDGGSGTGISSTPIYNYFVECSKSLLPNYLSFIIPSRWFAGGKGLDDFRKNMLNDSRISKIFDFMSSKDCFNNADIAGGVNFFLWEQKYNGLCEINNCDNKGIMSSSTRPLNEFNILVRDNLAISIIHKFVKSGDKCLADNTYTRNPFGFVSKERGAKKPFKGRDNVILFSSGGKGFVKRSDVIKSKEIIDQYKVIIGKIVPSNGEVDINPHNGYRVTTASRILKPGEIHTESYLLLHNFNSHEEAENFADYMVLKFPRFMMKHTLSSMNISTQNFIFVPFLDYTKKWTDEELYERYKLTQAEKHYIESYIKPIK